MQGQGATGLWLWGQFAVNVPWVCQQSAPALAPQQQVLLTVCFPSGVVKLLHAAEMHPINRMDKSG